MAKGPISQAVIKAWKATKKRLSKAKFRYGKNTMTDEIGDMIRVKKSLDKALDVLALENYYY